MRLPLNIEQHLTLFSVYSPTPQAEPAEKERFYSDLRRLLQSTPAVDNVPILAQIKPRKSVPRGKKLIVSDLRSAEVKAKFQAGLHSLL
ncbi:unnamed protein product, partial [Porites evermanni]